MALVNFITENQGEPSVPLIFRLHIWSNIPHNYHLLLPPFPSSFSSYSVNPLIREGSWSVTPIPQECDHNLSFSFSLHLSLSHFLSLSLSHSISLPLSHTHSLSLSFSPSLSLSLSLTLSACHSLSLCPSLSLSLSIFLYLSLPLSSSLSVSLCLFSLFCLCS